MLNILILHITTYLSADKIYYMELTSIGFK